MINSLKTLRNVSKLKIFYILSLVILATLLIFAVFKPFAEGTTYTEIGRQSLLKTQDEWILQFDILNHEGRDVKYTIHTLVSGQDYQEDFMVRDGEKSTYIHHVNAGNIGNGQVTYRIYKENESSPVDQGTYYLK